MPEPTAPAPTEAPAAAPTEAPPTSQATPQASQQADTAPAAAAARPDWLPESYWNAEAGAADVERLARDHAALGARFAKGKEGVAEALRAEWEAEQRKALPETPDGYALRPPAALTDPGLVVLDAPPGPDFEADPAKKYVVLQPDHPMLGLWRDLAHKTGLTQDQFDAGVAAFAAMQAANAPTAAEAEAQKRAFYAELGDSGVARVAHLWGKLEATLGKDEAALFDAFVTTPAQVVALEKLLGTAAGPGFAAPQAEGARDLSEADLKALIADPRYWRERDPAVVKQVEAGFKRLYPGTVRSGTGGRGG